MFGFFKKAKTAAVEDTDTVTDNDAGPFRPIVEVGTVFDYIKVEYQGGEMSLAVNTKTPQEAKFALEELKLLRKTIQSVKKEVKSQIAEIRQDHANRVANRGAMIPGGGKIGMALRFAVRSDRAVQRGTVSSQIKYVQDSVINPLDQLLLGCDKIEIVLKKEILADKS